MTRYATAQVKDPNLKSENIADGVTVLGIRGTHNGGMPFPDPQPGDDGKIWQIVDGRWQVVPFPEMPDPYELPIAASSVLGGVNPLTKTADMTQPVGVNNLGRLFTLPTFQTYKANVTDIQFDEETHELNFTIEAMDRTTKLDFTDIDSGLIHEHIAPADIDQDYQIVQGTEPNEYTIVCPNGLSVDIILPEGETL